MYPTHYTTPTRKDAASAIQALAAAPSLSVDPAWRAAQGRVLVVMLVGAAGAIWLANKGRWILATATLSAAAVLVLRQLRVIEHMARVSPPNSPVNDASVITPSASDLIQAGGRPTYHITPDGHITNPEGATVTLADIAQTDPEIFLSGPQGDAFWAAVESLNLAGVHVLDGGA